MIRFSLGQQPNFKNTASNSTDLMRVVDGGMCTLWMGEGRSASCGWGRGEVQAVDGGGEKCKLWMEDGQVCYQVTRSLTPLSSCIKSVRINLDQACGWNVLTIIVKQWMKRLASSLLTTRSGLVIYRQAGASDFNASWYQLNDYIKVTSPQQTYCNLYDSGCVYKT